jgi:hypothetical protein
VQYVRAAGALRSAPYDVISVLVEGCIVLVPNGHMVVTRFGLGCRSGRRGRGLWRGRRIREVPGKEEGAGNSEAHQPSVSAQGEQWLRPHHAAGGWWQLGWRDRHAPSHRSARHRASRARRARRQTQLAQPASTRGCPPCRCRCEHQGFPLAGRAPGRAPRIEGTRARASSSGPLLCSILAGPSARVRSLGSDGGDSADGGDCSPGGERRGEWDSKAPGENRGGLGGGRGRDGFQQADCDGR